VKTAVKSDEAGPAGDGPGQLERALDGFGAAVAKKEHLHPRRQHFGQGFGQLQQRFLHGNAHRRVDHPLGLLPGGRHHPRMAIFDRRRLTADRRSGG
jgi:hypothetical protein